MQWIRILKLGALFKDVSVAVEHSFSKNYQNGSGGKIWHSGRKTCAIWKIWILWTGLCSPKVHVEFLTPVPLTVTVFGDGAIKEVVKEKQGHMEAG